jgi:cysteine dioxygenase
VRLDDLVLATCRCTSAGLAYDDLLDLAARLDLSAELVDAHLFFDAERYARNLVLRTPVLELLVLCWLPGQQTLIHDHGRSVNAIRVHGGELTSRLFSAADGEPARMTTEEAVSSGGMASLDRTQIHQLANTSQEKLVTIHMYSPPLTTITAYSTESAERTPVRLRYSVHDDLG